MSDFRITYSYPWLLLLIIPALLLVLIPYFRMNKKLRCTRNRIISMVLHTVAMVLAVNLLAGIGFSYEVPNTENEVIILVDDSESGEKTDDEKDDFVRSVIDVCGDGCKIGVVRFGNGCKVAAELTQDKSGVYDKYLLSERPDGTATALADALRYTASLFTSPDTARIVVVSDGLETDGDAVLTLNEITSKGIAVDSVFIPRGERKDIQIVSAEVADTDIVVGESFTINIIIENSSQQTEEAAVLRLYDNGKLYGETVVGISGGRNEFPASLAINERGMHELMLELVTDYELFGDPLPDEVKNNNSYRTYVNLEVFENILLIERYENESEKLKGILSETKNVTDISVERDKDLFPRSIEKMAEYEQIVLVNIAYSDMPEGFEELLNEYVYELGGGLFTVGGRNDYDAGGNLVSHAYNRQDLAKSEYFKQMLPVNAEDYTPPIAVMLVIDTSLSMKSTGKLEAAIAGAGACLDALHDRDFCGVVSFSTASSERLSVLPVSQRETISEAIKKVKDDAGGGTIFSDAIMKAGRALSVINNVERKHIILVTDGAPGDSFEDYKGYIADNVADGITMSVLTLGLKDADKEAAMLKTATEGDGKFYNVSDVGSISSTMYKDLTEEAIPEIEYGKAFKLTVKDRSTILTGIDHSTIPTLSGYYGTVPKKGATVPLMGEYVPIYATHKYGKGTVGSFMCDLNGEWSGEFVESVVGRAIVMNIVESIFPAADVRADGIKYEIKDDNYSHWVNIHGAPEGHTVEVSVNPVSTHLQHLYGEINVKAAEIGKRFTFTITEPGLYEIKISVYNESGEAVNEIPVYRAFSYSKEYDSFTRSDADAEAMMTLLADEGRGVYVTDPADVFSSLDETLVKKYDPRIILIITTIVLILLDIAVRKFKFKWLHEIIREKREEKQ